MGFLDFLKKEYGYIRRYNQILRVLAKYGFEDMVAYLDEHKRFGFIRKLIPKRAYARSISLTKWEKMRLVCEELGPTFIKFGQILSNRPDLLPPELIVELEKLQDGVPPEAGPIAVDIIESELNLKIADIFEVFSTTALASASIAQVHRGRLKTGEEIVVKVQRPHIQEIIVSDLKAMYYVADILNRRVPEVRNFDPVGLVKMFEDSILKEMDFVHESINLQRFANNYKNDPDFKGEVYLPKVYQQFTTGKVLTLEYIQGIKVSDYKKLDGGGFDKEIIATRLINSYFKQVFDYGFFHADPHPGNIFVLPGNVICFIDYGMMGTMIQRDIDQLASLFIAVRASDVKKIIRTLLMLSDRTVVKNYRELEYDVTEFVNNYSITQLHQNEMGTLLLEIKDIIIRHGLKVPVHFFLLARSLVTAEGVARNLHPEVDITGLARPFMLKAIGKKYNPLDFGKKVLNSFFEIGSYMEDFPRDLKNAIRKINSGEIKVDLQHKGIDPVIHSLNRISKQLVSAVIIGALVVGGSLLIVAQTPPLWKNVSALGIMAFILATILSFGLMNNLRKGDHD
jgi:ubiquinone biosynthesis protein